MSDSIDARAPLCISSIRIHGLKESVRCAELKIGSRTEKLHGESDPGKILIGTFYPVLEVFVEEIFLSVEYRHSLIPKKKHMDVSFTRDNILSKAVDLEFRETRGNIKIVIEIGSNQPSGEAVRQERLESSTSEILRACPRFRLLVIGKSGVGKSTLIRRAFKVTDVDVSANTRGEADINTEFTSQENGKFVLHDSMGFEGGDENKMEIVKSFIAHRNSLPDVKDRIHAIWLCVSIPYAKERLLESGIADFVKSRKQILGKIPIIVVFTKLDVYAGLNECEAMKTGEALNVDVEKLKKTNVHQLCIKPLRGLAGNDILHAIVSTEDEYESTLRQLMDVTTANIENYVSARESAEPALTAMMAQRVDIDLKIKASIAVGKKRHWKGLVAGVNFIGYTLNDCLSVIHDDIIEVWNFQDGSNHLSSDRFRKLILHDLDATKLPDTQKAFEFGLGTISALAGILTPLAGPLIPIVLPVAAGAVVIAWLYQVYKRTDETLRRIMTYIVDLTCVMQILFLLAPEGDVERPVIELAVQAYDRGAKDHVHATINSRLRSMATHPGRDSALDTIVELIDSHSIKGGEARELRAKIPKTM